MQLPNAESATIEPGKITRFLLNVEHPYGGPRARRFRELGYNEETVDLLAQQLLAIAREGEVASSRPTEGGINYVIYGELEAPSGHRQHVRTVWYIAEGDNRPRLNTVIPLGRRRRRQP